jgi:hypothetical protein
MTMIDKKEFPIPVAVVGKAIIYTCLKPKSQNYDGYFSENGVDTPIKVYPLYFHLNDGGIQSKLDEWRLIDTTEFHKQFWEMKTRSDKMPMEKWIAMFSTRSEPISPDILASVGIKPEDLYGKEAAQSSVSPNPNTEKYGQVKTEQQRLRTALHER